MTTSNDSGRAPTTPGRMYETVARLDITAFGAEAQLVAQSPNVSADLILSGKGAGVVRVGDSEILTVKSLGDLDGLAAALAGITIEGADPAAVLALQAQAKSILDAFGGKPDSTVADLLNYIANIDDGIGSINNSSTAALTSITGFLTAVAGNPDPSAITIAGGGIVGLAVTAWNDLLAQVASGGGGQLGGGAIDEGAVNALIGAVLAAMIMPILDGHTTDIAGLNTKLATVQALVANLVGEIAEIVASTDGCGFNNEAVNTLILEGVRPTAETIQRLLDLLAVKQDATVDDVAVIWQALSDGSVALAQLLSALSGKPLSDNPTVADVQAGLPVLFQTLIDAALSQQIFGPLNVLPSLNAGIVGNTSEIVALSPNNNSVNLDLQAPNGVVLANGQQILSPSQINEAALAAVMAWLAVDLNQSNGVVGAYINGLGQDLAQEIQTRTEQIEGLNFGYKHLRETLVLPTIRAITGSTDTSVGGGVDGPAVAAVKPAMDQIRADIAAAQAAVVALEALGVGGGDGTGLTAEQAQMILDTATDLAKIIVGVSGAGGTPDDFVATLGTLALQVRTAQGTADTAQGTADTIATDLAKIIVGVSGAGGTPDDFVATLGTLALQARTAQGTADTIVTAINGGTIAGSGAINAVGASMDKIRADIAAKADKTTLELVQGGVETLQDQMVTWSTAIQDIGELVVSLRDTVESHGERITALEAENATLKSDLSKKADNTQLASYAKLNDGNQEFTAGLIKVGGVQFTRSDEVLVPLDFPDYGKRLAIIPKDSENLDEAGILVVHTDIGDLASGDVTSAQLTQAINEALGGVQAPLDVLVRRTQNLSDNGTLSTQHVLGDAFLDDNGQPVSASLQESLQLLLDVLYGATIGSFGSSGNTLTTVYEALVEAFQNGTTLTAASTENMDSAEARELQRQISILNTVLNSTRDRVDILWNRPGRISITEAEWEPCTITYGATGVYAPPSGGIEAAEVDDVIYLRGGLSTNTFRSSITTGGFLSVGKLPQAMSRPQVSTLLPVWAILTGSSYRIAVIRIGTDGVISVSGPTGAIDGFDVTGASFPAGGIAARSIGEEDLSLLDAGGDGEQFDSIDDLEERLQLFMDAIDGPDATPEKMQQTFWLINDVLSRLLEASGMQITGRAVPELVAIDGAPRQIFAQGIDPETPVPKSYLMGLVIGLTTTKLNKLIALDLIPSFKQGSSIMIKPADVAAAMETAGMYSEAEETQYAEVAQPVIGEQQ